MFALQSLLPVYLNVIPNNFLEVPNNYLIGSSMILFMLAQVFVLRTQQLWGSRWFVPEKWRRNSNAYIYDRALILDEESTQEAVCVICLNQIRIQVDVNGAPIIAPVKHQVASGGVFQMLGLNTSS